MYFLRHTFAPVAFFFFTGRVPIVKHQAIFLPVVSLSSSPSSLSSSPSNIDPYERHFNLAPPIKYLTLCSHPRVDIMSDPDEGNGGHGELPASSLGTKEQ